MANWRSIALLVLAAAASAQQVRFNRDVRPILSDKCFVCHGPDAQNRKTPLRLDTAEGAAVELIGGGAAIVPGDPAGSALIERVKIDDPIRRMPPAYEGHDKLTDEEIGVLESWIEQGGEFEGHWAFTPPTRPEVPELGDAELVRNPIDAFVQRGLRRAGLEPSPEAGKTQLIRRVSLDLTGLPPTPEQVDAFLADDSPQAYQRVVDRLLASPHYGERMAFDWLDAARYADTNGYQTDGVRSMWPWRDWVVRAFNANLPFDQFTIWQLAGDLLPDATREQVLATGFHRNNRTSGEGGIVEEEFLAEYAADRAETTGTVWLGLTVGCARCHDHKYDPITQKDYYKLFAFFNNMPERGLVYNFGNDGPQIAAPTPQQEQRLEGLTQQARKAHEAWAALEPKLAKAQRKWEKTLVTAGGDEASREGLLARYPLGEGLAPDAFTGVDDPDEDLEPSPASAEYGEGVFGRAASFDGTRFLDGGAVGGFQYDDQFTVSLWIKPEKVDDVGVVSRMHDVAEGSGWGILLREGRVRVEFTMRHTDHSMRVETKRRLAPGQWHHLALTFTGELPSHQGLTIWVDGEAWPFELEWDDLKWPIGYRNYPLRIGAAAGRRFEGAIDELRLYGRTLSPAQIVALGVRKPLAEIARANERSAAETLKLRTAFLETALPEQLRRARFAAREAERKRARFEATIPTVMVMRDGAEPKQAYVLERGAYDAHGEPVTADAPAALPPLPAGVEPNRLALARWLVDPANPLPARVTVNRLWQMLFGRGIVKTVQDFGSQGAWPTHPDLLDWLAAELVESGWDVKRLLETMVMSHAYRQASRIEPELLERDPENALLARGPRVRLPAPAIRDQALAVSGLLQEQLGGPPVKPYQPPGLWKELSSSSYKPDNGEKLYRRSLYTYWKRTVAPPAMVAFDASDREVCTVRQTRTNTPLQALNLMNDVTYLEAARKLAERMMGEAGPSAEQRIERGFRLTAARRPDQGELRALTALYSRLLEDFRADRFEAELYLAQGESERDEDADVAELAAFASVASLMLNLDETITKE